MSGYTRQQSYIDGDVILAEHTNDEFDALAEAFSTTLGHKHDGTTAEGPTIDIISDNDGDTRITVEAAADEDNIRFFTAATERLTIADTGNITFLKDSFFNAPTTHALLTTFNGEVRFNSDPVTFNVKPAFDGGLSGVSAPFTVDSTFLVTNLNADLLDGQQGSFYTTGTNITAASTTTRGTVELATSAETITGTDTTRAVTPSGLAATYTAADVLTKIKTVDGAGSNLDADLLDGVQGSDYARISVGNVFSLSQTVANNLPQFRLRQLDGAVNEKNSYILSDGNSFFLRFYDDIESTSQNAYTITRSGIQPQTHQWFTGTSERVRIDSTGNVAINKTSASYRLDVSGSIATDTSIFVNSYGLGGPLTTITSHVNNTNDAEIHIQKARGGSSTPLQISAGDDVGAIRFRAYDGTQFSDAASIICDSTTNTGNFGGVLQFLTNGAEQVRIDSSGNVGIGETTPLGKLHVKTADSGAGVSASADELVVEGSADSGISILSGTASAGNIFFGDSVSGTIGRIAYDHSGDFMRFYTSNSERVRIDTGGTFMVGTTDITPYNNTGTNTGVAFSPNGEVFAAASFPALVLNKLVSDGNTTVFRRDGVIVGSISVTGTTTTYNTTSDYRLKENVVPISNSIDRVKALNPSRFNFISHPNQTLDGFIAHEVQEIVPEAVIGEKDGEEMQQLDASKLVPLLTAALKEAVDRIEALEERITILENN